MEAVISTSEPETFTSPTMCMPSVSSKKERLLSAPSFAKGLKSRDVEAVVLNDLSSLWLAPIFRFYGLKVVSLLHLYLQRKNEAGLGHGWLEVHLLRMASRFAHRVYSVNKDNQKSFPVPVEFVGNFISPWFFGAQDSENKCYDLGLIARLSEEKNVPLFVRLVAKLNEVSERPITALIVGRGEEESLVRREIERLEMQELIELRAWIDRYDLPGVYDQLKCFAITSHHEGFATTLLEAHARSVPAITTHSAGYCSEFVDEVVPVTGLVFDPRDVESEFFLRRVLGVIEDHASYREGCRYKAEQFTEERVLGHIYAGIKNLTGKRAVKAAE
ncbi:glycosyltransferase [Halomonas saccharevitans]|uniref:Glycosyltransferase n=1 Tax=Halomonas saccharevitans TaxID=416872 RepID=A0ABU3NB24_9GAMM|nr:glycosyltransferase [Halomonas saccharevitans]MDT8878307.1 glycosyltransferase [Halomonas saccharevitans]